MVVKEIRLRKIPDELFIQLEMMSEKFQYSNLSDFLMSQLYRIVENNGLDLYENKFATILADIKEKQAQILDQMLKNEIKLLAYHAKQDIVEELTTDWLRFMDDVDALAAERRAGGR